MTFKIVDLLFKRLYYANKYSIGLKSLLYPFIKFMYKMDYKIALRYIDDRSIELYDILMDYVSAVNMVLGAKTAKIENIMPPGMGVTILQEIDCFKITIGNTHDSSKINLSFSHKDKDKFTMSKHISVELVSIIGSITYFDIPYAEKPMPNTERATTIELLNKSVRMAIKESTYRMLNLDFSQKGK